MNKRASLCPGGLVFSFSLIDSRNDLMIAIAEVKPPFFAHRFVRSAPPTFLTSQNQYVDAKLARVTAAVLQIFSCRILSWEIARKQSGVGENRWRDSQTSRSSGPSEHRQGAINIRSIDFSAFSLITSIQAKLIRRQNEVLRTDRCSLLSWRLRRRFALRWFPHW